jgi:hypothetical protein
LNGNIERTSSVQAFTIGSWDSTTRIGQRATGQFPFNGKIAQVQTYNKQLTQAEILQNYYGGPIVTSGLTLALDSGNLISYESGSTTMYSMTGSNSGSLLNGTSYNNNNGGSWVFDGVDDYATTTALPNNLGMISGSFSIGCWFYCNNLAATNGGLVNSRTIDSAGNTYEMGVRFSSIWVGFYGEDQYVPIANNKWYYAVHTYNYTTKSSKLYVNNVLSNTITRTTNLATTSAIKIGTYSSTIRSFNGNINIVQIYNKELSAQEVAQNFNAQRQRFGI